MLLKFFVDEVHEGEQGPPLEIIKMEEDLNEAYNVEDRIHDEGPIENVRLLQDETRIFAPPFNEDEVTQASVSPPHEDKGVVSCTPCDFSLNPSNKP
jgi:hypothetical protein